MIATRFWEDETTIVYRMQKKKLKFRESNRRLEQKKDVGLKEWEHENRYTCDMF